MFGSHNDCRCVLRLNFCVSIHLRSAQRVNFLLYICLVLCHLYRKLKHLSLTSNTLLFAILFDVTIFGLVIVNRGASSQKCVSIVTSHLRLLIACFLLQTSLFDDPFHMNRTFREKSAIFHPIL